MDKRDINDTYKFHNIPDGIEICNFGSSHGLWAFDYEVTELKGFNFALQAQTLEYDDRLLINYKDHLAEGAVVFIPVSYHSLYGPVECNIPYTDEKNARYYTILPRELIKDYDFRTDIFMHYFSSLTAGPDLIRTLGGRSHSNHDADWSTAITPEEAQDTAELVANSHILNEKLDNNGQRIINEEAIYSVKDMIKTCQELNCRPILITLPFLRNYNDAVENLDPNFYDNFYYLINEITEETDTEYYDYSKDERFCDSYDLFKDSNHLNRKGACLFTDILMKEVVMKED